MSIFSIFKNIFCRKRSTETPSPSIHLVSPIQPEPIQVPVTEQEQELGLESSIQHAIDKSLSDSDSEEFNVDTNMIRSRRIRNSLRSSEKFTFLKSIGEGSFSTVYLAKRINTNQDVAIKVCNKKHLHRENKINSITREVFALETLNKSGSSYFVRLFCTLQDVDNIYFVMNYVKNGELLPFIRKVDLFDIDCAQFYSAQILCALEVMHALSILHRDLKPENILLDEKMHIKVVDFGSSKFIESTYPRDEDSDLDSDCSRERKYSFVGTAQYVSPEVLNEEPVSASSDLWAFGCIIYQMITGLPPFRSKSEYLVFQRIVRLDITFPDFFDTEAKDLVRKLLTLQPTERLGAMDPQRYSSIRAHSFYNGLEFDKLLEMESPLTSHAQIREKNMQSVKNISRPSRYLTPGLNQEQLMRLMGLSNSTMMNTIEALEPQSTPVSVPVPEQTPRQRRPSDFLQMSEQEKLDRLDNQREHNEWHQTANENLIIKQGLVSMRKHKSLFSNKYMLMLTAGPHLYYANPETKILIGEIPWSSQVITKVENFKKFFIHTPNQSFHFQDPEGFALEWCKVIDEMLTWNKTPEKV